SSLDLIPTTTRRPAVAHAKTVVLGGKNGWPYVGQNQWWTKRPTIKLGDTLIFRSLFILDPLLSPHIASILGS
ncbi:unnamed protein product, partial [Closterium sp. NIES-65]